MACKKKQINRSVSKKNIVKLNDCEKNKNDEPLLDDSFLSVEKNIKNMAPETRFIIKEPLGSGGMCEVYSALDLRRADWDDICPYVAIKKLLPEFKNNYQAQLALAQEYAKARILSHPGIIKIYDIHKSPEDDICLSMELFNGQTLQNYLNSLNKELSLKTAKEIYSALSHIHDKGLVHADLKPGNIFLNSKQAVIFDFNISVAVHNPGQASSPIQALVKSQALPAYTIAYATIERLKGEKPSFADDVFAASCTIYELFTGKHPYKRLSAIEAYEKKIKPERIKNLSWKQWYYLKNGLDFNPLKRPLAAELCQVFTKSSSIFNIFF